MIYGAYGSNIDIRQMHDRLHTNFKDIGPAILKGYKLVFRGDNEWGYFADVKYTGKSCDKVLLYLYEMNKEAFTQMDKYEQVDKNRYYRKIVKCKMLKLFGKEKDVIIYKMNNKNKEKYQFGWPSNEYFGKIFMGYLHRKFPMKELRNIYKNLLIDSLHNSASKTKRYKR